jgi:hypothetical protein
MRLIKLYGKEDMEKIVKQESDKIVRRLDKSSKRELRQIVYETNKELSALRVKMNDIEKIMERYENKY